VKLIAALALVALFASGCGLAVQEPDLFLLTRTGQGAKLTELVNSDGTIKCNGKQGKQLPDQLLLNARNIQPMLDYDANRRLAIPRSPNAVYLFSVKVDAGTITFPDTAGATHPALAQLALFAVQAAQQSCGLS
jgi:hypothetical protein